MPTTPSLATQPGLSLSQPAQHAEEHAGHMLAADIAALATAGVGVGRLVLQGDQPNEGSRRQADDKPPQPSGHDPPNELVHRSSFAPLLLHLS